MNPTILHAREILHNVKDHDFESCGNYQLEHKEAEKLIEVLGYFLGVNIRPVTLETETYAVFSNIDTNKVVKLVKEEEE